MGNGEDLRTEPADFTNRLPTARMGFGRVCSMALRVFMWLGWLAYLAGCLMILENSISDFGPGGTGFFVEDKGVVGESGLWRMSLYLHVGAGLVCLFSVLSQFSRTLLRKLPALHRIAGRIYVLSVLFILCPTGFYLGIHAKGGIPGQLGFLTLAVATFHTTLNGWRAVLPGRRNLTAHREWMIRSFALAASAVSFRVFYFLGFVAGFGDQANYVGSLWLSIFLNLGVAELIIRQRQTAPQSTQLHTA